MVEGKNVESLLATLSSCIYGKAKSNLKKIQVSNLKIQLVLEPTLLLTRVILLIYLKAYIPLH